METEEGSERAKPIAYPRRNGDGPAVAIKAKYDGMCHMCMKPILLGEPALFFDHRLFCGNAHLNEYAEREVPVVAKKNREGQQVVPGAYADLEARLKEVVEKFQAMQAWNTERWEKLREALK